MPIELTCPGCAKTLRLGDEHAGKTGKCPACETLFQIPLPAAPIAPAPLGPTSPTNATNLFGENANAGASPFADTVNDSMDNLNPYSSPNMQSPYAAGSGANSSTTAAIVLGAISIAMGLPSFCCCLGFVGSLGCGIIGLILTFQAPRQERSLPLALNLIGLVIPFLWFLLALVFGIFGNRQGF
jgi:hypothetical protein